MLAAGRGRTRSRLVAGTTLPFTSCGPATPEKGFVEVWFDGELVVPRAKTATLLDLNPAFFQIGFMRNTSDVPETIIFDHVIEATTLKEVTPPPIMEKPPAPTGKASP